MAPNVQVTLAGMTIENGDGRASNGGVAWSQNDLDGGGIRNFGRLTVSGCTVTGNRSSWDGGGIANEFGGTLAIIGSTVSQNNNLYPGGYVGGGGVYNDGAMTLSGSTVTQNGANGGLGDGIFNDRSGTLTILSSTVKNNHGTDLYNLGTWSADSGSSIGKVGP